MFFIYVLLNELSGKIYIGQTENLKKRLGQHNDPNFDVFGKNAYTKINHGTWKLVYSEEFQTRVEAIRREKALKSSRGRHFIHNKILATTGR